MSVHQAGADALSVTTSVVQIIFWVTIAVFTFLAYRQARLTLFQPLRTEAYKLQLLAVNSVSGEFYGLRQVGLTEYFDLPRTVYMNQLLLLDSYAKNVFHAQSDEFDERWLRTLNDTGRTNFRPRWEYAGATPSPRPDASEVSERTGNWAPTRWAAWATAKNLEAMQRIRHLAADPLLPTDVAEAVGKVIDAASQNVQVINEIIVEQAPLLPNDYPDLKSLNYGSSYDIHNRWAERSERLETAVDSLLTTIRAHFAPDELGWKPKRGRRSPDA